MIKIIPITKERVKKFNLFGADISIGFAKYAKRLTKPSITQGITEWFYYEDINYLVDHNEEDGIITHRFIFWRFKLEVKSVVHYDFKFA